MSKNKGEKEWNEYTRLFRAHHGSPTNRKIE